MREKPGTMRGRRAVLGPAHRIARIVLGHRFTRRGLGRTGRLASARRSCARCASLRPGNVNSTGLANLLESSAFVIPNKLGERGSVKIRQYFTELLAVGTMRSKAAVEFS